MATVLVILVIAAGVVTLLAVRRDPGTGSPGDGRPGGGQPGGGQPRVTQSAGTASYPAGSAPTQAPGGSGAPGATAPPPDQQPTPDGLVDVNAADYVGQDRDIVVRQLEQLGLRTQIVDTAEASAAPPGTVLKISPSGLVPVGTVINVFALPKDRGRNR